ncbi:MAG: hypothetical protein V1708_03730 [Candidatus Micrarchaeota archaeon]
MPEEKKIARKVESKPPMPPSSVAPRSNPVRITLSLNIDPSVRQKAPILLAILVLFLFSCFMLNKANFSIADLFNFSRVGDNLSKLYSVSFLLFVLVFSIDLALAAVYGFKLESQTALASMFLLALPLLIAGYLYPRYFLAFLALCFPVGLTAFFTSMLDKLNLSSLYSSIGKAFLIFAILAAAFAFAKVQADKDAYFNTFLGSVVHLAPTLQGQLQGSVADVIENIQINSSSLSAAFAQDLGGSNGSAPPLVSRDTVAAYIAQTYDSYRLEMVASFADAAERQYADTRMPKFAGLPAAKKDALIDSAYAQFTPLAGGAGTQIGSPAIADKLSGLWPKIRTALADQVRSAPPMPVDTLDVATLKGKLSSIEIFNTFYNNFEFFAAFILFSMLSLAGYAFKILAALFAFGLAKLVM